MTSANATCHATAVALALDADGPLAGVVLLGHAGAGKTTLAIQLIETCPFGRSALIADDLVTVSSDDAGRLTLSAGPQLPGYIEVRPYGVLRGARSTSAPTSAVAAFQLGDVSDRLVEPQRWTSETTPTAGVPLFWGTCSAQVRALTRAVLTGQFAQSVAL